MMDFRQIEAFVSVSRLKSFSKAAENLYLTQPTISTHINSLENELGVKLFDRSNKEILLTKAGEIFLEYAVNMINTRDMAVFSLHDYSKRLEGRLQVAASSIPAQHLLPTVIMSFSRKYENIKFSLVQLDSLEVIESVLDKKFEIGIVGSDPQENKLSAQFLCEDELVLITAGDDHSFDPNTKTLTFHEIENKSFILREAGSGTRTEFERALIKKGYNPGTLRVIAQINNTEAVIQAVRQGLGVAVVSSLSIKDYEKLGLVRSFQLQDMELKRAFYLITRKNRPISPLAQVFQSFVANYFTR